MFNQAKRGGYVQFSLKWAVMSAKIQVTEVL